MSRIIAVFNSGTGVIEGFRDFRQAMDHLKLEKKSELDGLLKQGGGFHEGSYVSELVLHKSNRGGLR